MSSAADLSAVALLAAFRARTLSPAEVWADVEARIAAWEPVISALYAYDPEAAREAAAESTERWARGAPIGPFDGIPATLKELIATRGTPVPLGTAATQLVPAAADAPPAARLRQAGAILFAKTTVPDYGMLSSGLSSFHALARNPWNPACNPGGSSAGAAAAGAAGYGPFHVGTDIGGSVRLPAGWCGLVGFKPTNGRIPIDPCYLGRSAGPMTRTVADAALMMTALALPDSRDPTSLAPEAIDWTGLDGFTPKGLRIGLMLDAGCGMAVEPAVAEAVTRAAGWFTDAGAEVVPVAPVLSRAMLDGLDDFWRARSWIDLAALSPEARGRVLPYIVAWAEKGAGVSGTAAVAGFNQTYAMRRTAAALFDQVDLVLSPTNPVVQFPAGWASPVNDPARPFEHIAFTVPWNMGEQPAVSVNCGFSGGMPIGLQIVGPRFADRQVLQAARFVEQARPEAMVWPRVPG